MGFFKSDIVKNLNSSKSCLSVQECCRYEKEKKYDSLFIKYLYVTL